MVGAMVSVNCAWPRFVWNREKEPARSQTTGVLTNREVSSVSPSHEIKGSLGSFYRGRLNDVKAGLEVRFEMGLIVCVEYVRAGGKKPSHLGV